MQATPEKGTDRTLGKKLTDFGAKLEWILRKSRGLFQLRGQFDEARSLKDTAG